MITMLLYVCLDSIANGLCVISWVDVSPNIIIEENTRTVFNTVED